MRKVTFAIMLAACASLGAAPQAGWDYTALGDSFATGYLATSGYVPRYQGFLEADNGISVTLFNLGQNGWHSGQLLTALQTKAAFQMDVQEAQVVTWNIGINDLTEARLSYKRGKCGTGRDRDNQDCLRTAVATFNTNWDGIVNQILLRRSQTNTIIRTMDLYNPWVAVDQSSNTTADSNETGPAHGNDFAVIEYYLDAMNAHIAQSAAVNSIPLAQVHAAFNGATGTEDPVAKGLIASDGLHPNDIGHEAIAQAYRALGYSPLR